MTHGNITFLPEDKRWRIECTPDAAMRLKRIFPRLIQNRSRVLSVKETTEVANDLEWALLRFPMVISDADRDRLTLMAKSHREMLERMEKIHRFPPRCDAFKLALPLRDYQTLPVALYLEQQHLLVGDEVGLGKTVVATASFSDPRTLPALVVVKPHLQAQWKEEIRKFLPDCRIHVVATTKEYPLPEADVYIISISKLSAWWGIFASRIKSVVFDEIQEFRRTTSEKYKAAKDLCELTPFRLGLSATPIHNYGSEIWNIYNLVAPDRLGTEEEFIRERCLDGKSVDDPVALGQYLRDNNLFIRRTRKEVGRELPPIVRYVQEIEFDRHVYEKGVSAAEQLAKLVLTGSFVERGQASREFDLRVRQATGLSKAPFVAALVRMLVESGEKVLLGGWHHAVYDVWAEKLADLNPVFFTGRETPAQKEKARQAFITGESKVMIMNLRSGAGTNGLQNVASVVVLGEIDWTPAVHHQFIGRLARDGQDSSVQVFIPLAPVGSDPVMADILGLKEMQATGIIEPFQNTDRDIDIVEVDPDRIKRLAREFLTKRGVLVPVADAA